MVREKGVSIRIRAFIVFFLFSIPFSKAYAVHDEIGKAGCLECHYRLPFINSNLSFNDATGLICGRCHSAYHGMAEGFSHPVKIAPSMVIPPDLPLDAKGRLTCITCHTYHIGYKDAYGNKGYFLRRSRGKTFCYSCHKKRL